MDQAGSTSIGKRILGALGACLTAACASNAPYHTASDDGGACRTDPDSPACRSSAYQEFERFDLAFAEFSERGNAFDDARVEAVLAKIAAKARADGVVLIKVVLSAKNGAFQDATFTSRGFMSNEDSQELYAEIKRRTQKLVQFPGNNLQRDIENMVKGLIYEDTRRQPVIFVTMTKE